MRLRRGPDEVDDLVVTVPAHVPPVDEHHLVALVQTRVAPIRGSVGAHARHDHRHLLVGAALHVEPEPAALVRQDGDHHQIGIGRVQSDDLVRTGDRRCRRRGRRQRQRQRAVRLRHCL